METRTEITIKPALHGHVKVTIEVGRESWTFVWRMSEEEARQEAEEIMRQKAR